MNEIDPVVAESRRLGAKILKMLQDEENDLRADPCQDEEGNVDATECAINWRAADAVSEVARRIEESFKND